MNSTDDKGRESRDEKKKNARVICKKFDNILTKKLIKEENVSSTSPFSKQLNELWEDAAEGIEKMKANKQFALGQKIPSSVKPFNRQ